MDIRKHYDQKMIQLQEMLNFPWQDKDFYAAWLTQSYYYSGRVTRILTLASAYSGMESPAQHKRFTDHAREEKGHELLAMRDVQDLGTSVQEVGEFAITKAFYRAQYFTIQHIGVEALMGWILPLEGLAIHWGAKTRAEVVKAAEKRPTRFFDVHVEEDPGHVDAAFKVLFDQGVSNPKNVIENMDMTVDLYFQILQTCKQWAYEKKNQKAA